MAGRPGAHFGRLNTQGNNASLLRRCCAAPRNDISFIIGGMDQKSLSSSAQKIQDQIKSLGYDYMVMEHAESTRTAQEAADRAGCELGQIVKSLIFKGKESGKPILVLTSGANRVDEKRISEYAGEAIGRADADFVRAVTGFAIGGVPPFGHLQKLETYFDEDFLQYETIWAAAGTPNAIFEVKTSDLQKMADAKTARVK
jgi:prolyl-tRNA editing enzyme YbaK/EbsC (Cys-tRNA(Pro) deacylase)